MPNFKIVPNGRFYSISDFRNRAYYTGTREECETKLKALKGNNHEH